MTALAADASLLAQATLAQEAASTSTGEAVVFWLLAPLATLAALGMLVSRKAVHSALYLAVTMISLAVLYIAQDAPFLGVVQVVVYTGAVMMLFLFVLMLVGVDASDSLIETIRGQRLSAALAGLGFALLLFFGVGDALSQETVGLAEANRAGNVEGVAELLFVRYALAFEATGVLLIAAAVGATVFTHREPQEAAPSQRTLSERRFLGSDHKGALPAPGVYARHNAVDTPALLPDGTPAEVSVSKVLVDRGDTRDVDEGIPRPEIPEGPRPADSEPDHTSSQLGKGPTP